MSISGRLFASMDNSKTPPITVGAGDGPTLSIVGDTYRIVASGKQTGGAYAAIDMLIPQHGGPGPHAHAHFQESFYVMEGEVEFTSEAGSYTAKQGSFIEIPLGGVVHCFTNKQEKVAHLLCFVVPAGLDEFFVEIGQPVEPGTFLPPPKLDPEKLKKLQAIAERYGQQVFPPNYFG
jgi:quercetin dioxygenase-like cupin family protein